MPQLHRELVDRIAEKYAAELAEDMHIQRGELDKRDFAEIIANAIHEAIREVERTAHA